MCCMVKRTVFLFLVNNSEGAGPFDRLYEETIIPDVNGSGAPTKNYLKPLFSPNSRNTVLLAAGEHIQVKWLMMNSLNGDCAELFTAITLSYHVTSAIKEEKKASAIATKFLSTDGNLPSGVTREDFMNHVLVLDAL